MHEIVEGIPLEHRADALLAWDEELLAGGVVLSEWATFLIQDTDLAFCAGADLAALLAAQAAMEAHLRHEYGIDPHVGFAAMIDRCPLADDMRARLHDVRRYRNRWGHVRNPEDDGELLEAPEKHRAELSLMASRAARLLREVVYLEQWL